MIPVAASFGISLWILTPLCVYMSIFWLLLYIILNLFQAACCVGCPYRGRYCPAFFGVYLGNRISSWVFSDEDFDPVVFRKNARWGEITLIVFLLFPIYWLFATQWYWGVLYIFMVILHVWIFLPTQCRKCSYNETCPGGRSYHFLCRLMKYRVGKHALPKNALSDRNHTC